MAVCVGLLLAAAGLGALSTTEHGLRVGEARLPSLCLLRNVTGLPCPGCGLTRSWVDLVRGDLGASLGHHRLGWLIMLYVAAQAIRHGLWLAVPRSRRSSDRLGGWLDRGLILIGVTLLGNWVVTLSQL